ncbi:lysoplasmalogenase family protein, partial [Pulveribacter sp.]
LFMLSDTLLAINRFVQPLPWSQVWVLSTYFAAQALIVAGMLRGLAAAPVATPEPAPAKPAMGLTT